MQDTTRLLLAKPLALILRFWPLFWFELRVHDKARKAIDSGQKVLFVVQHGHVYALLVFLLRNSRVPIDLSQCVTITSGSGDGRIGEDILKRRGVRCHRKSTVSYQQDRRLKSRQKASALRSMIRAFRSERRYGLLAINERSEDRRSRVCESTALIADNVSCMVIPVSVVCRSGLRLNSWDSAMLPFGKTTIALGCPVEEMQLKTLRRDERVARLSQVIADMTS